MHGLACAGFSVIACTSWSLFPSSSSTFLIRVKFLLSFPCPLKVHKFLPYGGLRASFSLHLSGLAHPNPWKFQPRNSKNPWLLLDACSESLLHRWFLAVASWLETYHCRNDSLASMYQNHDVDMH